MPSATHRTAIWRFTDGKPGHDRQSAGLIDALADHFPTGVSTFDAKRCRATVIDYLLARIPFAAGVPDPDLIIGAGRACQWPMLASRRARGGRTVYLMKPAWPIACFDVCLIPRHDDPPARANVIVTEGVLNDIEPTTGAGDTGLILVGGPSAHFAWDDAAVVEQVRTVAAAAPGRRWIITDSRRTPAATSERLAAVAGPAIEFVRCTDTDRDWLGTQFRRANEIWVSADSVSMIYEALATGAPVGLLELAPKRSSRVSRIPAALAAGDRITRFADWYAGRALTGGTPLREAGRCAALIAAGRTSAADSRP